MGRVKGCVVSKDILPAEHCGEVDGLFYVEEIPKSAIRGEQIVDFGVNVGKFGQLKLPSYLIGKKVSYIIIPEED